MNRAERRRQARAESKSDRMINVKVDSIRQMQDDAKSEAVNVAFVLMMSLPLIVLRDKHGFGKKRLSDFCELVLEQYRCFNEGYIGLDELRDILREETGIQLLIDKDIKVYKED